jgi:hypothetical protein
VAGRLKIERLTFNFRSGEQLAAADRDPIEVGKRYGLDLFCQHEAVVAGVYQVQLTGWLWSLSQTAAAIDLA